MMEKKNEKMRLSSLRNGALPVPYQTVVPRRSLFYRPFPTTATLFHPHHSPTTSPFLSPSLIIDADADFEKSCCLDDIFSRKTAAEAGFS